MKKFIQKVILFVVIVIGLLICILFLGKNPFEKHILAVYPEKIKLLDETISPKIIFIGGSNVCYGLNSKQISDSLLIPVVNTSIHAGIGLDFLMTDLEPHVNKGDIVVLIPEYHQLLGGDYYGGIEMVSVVIDIYPQGLLHLSAKQWKKTHPYFLKYLQGKLKNIFQENVGDRGIYDKDVFNKYGDACGHWNKEESSFFLPFSQNTAEAKINKDAINGILSFKEKVENKDAKFILLAPVLQSSSYDIISSEINLVKTELDKVGLSEHFSPQRYKFADNLIFDTPYHCNKKGVDLRTAYVIEDLKKILANQ